MGFFKWFTSKAKMKRWMFLILIGVVLVGYGISNVLYFDTLGFVEILKIVLPFIAGFTAIIVGFVFMQKRTLELLIEESDTRKETQNINKLIFNKKVYNQGPKIVVIGGGSGLNTVLKGLKNYTDNITAVVTVSDYGKTPTDSRKALQVLPLNDIKESLVALSYNEKEMEALLDTEFTSGQLKNLTFGDIYFLAMNNVHKNFTKSIESSKEVLNITGKVLLLSFVLIYFYPKEGKFSQDYALVIENRDKIPEYVSETSAKINRIFIRPTNCNPAPGVIDAIKEADAIVIGPGSLYTNVIPNLLVKGIAKAIRESNAIKIYVSNIMTELGQTDEYTLSDHIRTINEYVGNKIIDYCIYDTGEIIPEFIKKYNLKGSDVVLPDIQKAKDLGVRLVQRNLSKVEGDSIRHDSDVIASTIIQLICDELKFEDMQNDSQYMFLNSRLKETKREMKKRKKKEKKFQESGRKPFERRDSSTKSKFNTKYKDRIDSIKESDKKIKVRRKMQEVNDRRKK